MSLKVQEIPSRAAPSAPFQTANTTPSSIRIQFDNKSDEEEDIESVAEAYSE